MTRAAAIATVACVALCLASAAFAESIEDEVRDRVNKKLPPRLAVTDVQLSPALEKAMHKTVALRWKRAPKVGKVTVTATAKSQSGKPIRGWARLTIAKQRMVVVAARKLGAGATIRKGDLQLALRTGADGWAMRPSALLGSEVLRAVDAGSTIDDSAVEAPLPVDRGTTVNAIVRIRNVEVTTSAVLERRARPGESTTARLAMGKKVVRGVLLDSSTLLLEVSR